MHLSFQKKNRLGRECSSARIWNNNFLFIKMWLWSENGLEREEEGGKNDLSLQTALSSSSLSSTGNLKWQIQWLITAPIDANGKTPCGIQWEKDQTPNLDCCQQWGANVSLNRASLVSFLPHVSSANCQLSVESRLFRAHEESGQAGFAKPVEFEAVWTSWNIYQVCRAGDWLLQASSPLTSGQGSSPFQDTAIPLGVHVHMKAVAKMWHLHMPTSPKAQPGLDSSPGGGCQRDVASASITYFWKPPVQRRHQNCLAQPGPGFPCSCLWERHFPNA